MVTFRNEATRPTRLIDAEQGNNSSIFGRHDVRASAAVPELLHRQ